MLINCLDVSIGIKPREVLQWNVGVSQWQVWRSNVSIFRVHQAEVLQRERGRHHGIVVLTETGHWVAKKVAAVETINL